MTYALGASLQTAVYGRLASDPALDALVAGAVFDTIPDDAPDLFVAIGPERVSGRLDVTGSGAVHDISVSVVTRRGGYFSAKDAAGRVSEALTGSVLAMTRGRIVSIRFLRARTRRDEGEGTRRVDLWFRARVDDQTND